MQEMRYSQRRLAVWLTVLSSLMFLANLPALAQIRDYSEGSLTWDDFKGEVPDDTEFSAAVAGDIALETPTEDAKSSGGKRGVPPNDCIVCTKCMPNEAGKRKFKIKNTKKCRVKVKATLDQGRSWTKPDEQTPELLAHEQGHMDLWVATARSAEKEINSMMKCIAATNCGYEAKNSFRQVINDVLQEFRTKGQELQEKYDDETDHGRDKEKQKEWEKKIKDLLAIKGGPSWDEVNSLVSVADSGGQKIYVHPDNHPIVPLLFPEVVLNGIPYADGPLVFVLPSLTFEDHGGEHSRIWASDAPAKILIYDEAFTLVGSASFAAFYGNANDTEFVAELSGPVWYPTDEDLQMVPIEDPDALYAEDEDVNFDPPIFTSLTIKFPSALGEMLERLEPFQTFDCTIEIGHSAMDPDPADLNYDGVVTQADLVSMMAILEGRESQILSHSGDLNGDGKLDRADLEMLRERLSDSVVTPLPIDQ